MSDDRQTILRQAAILDYLIDTIRAIALVDEAKVCADPMWSVRQAEIAWKYARVALYSPSQAQPTPSKQEKM